MPLQEVNKGGQIILTSSSYVVIVPLVKTPKEDFFFYRMDAKRETDNQ